MDYRKLSDHFVLLLVVAVVAFGIAVLVRLAVLMAGLDVGTANLIFVVMLGIGAVLYLLLVKGIISLFDSLMAKRNGQKTGHAGVSIPAGESVHDRIVKERFEESIAIFCEYTAKVIRKTYIGRRASRAQQLH